MGSVFSVANAFSRGRGRRMHGVSPVVDLRHVSASKGVRRFAVALALVIAGASEAGTAAATTAWQPRSYAGHEGPPLLHNDAGHGPSAKRPARPAEPPAVVVAVVDTGVDVTHPALVAHLWTNPREIPGNGIDDDGDGIVDDVHGADFLNKTGDPSDTVGHGTHVAGIIAASPNPSVGSGGIDPDAKIMALRVDDKGWMDLGAAAAAIRYAADHGARVINLSWGNRVDSPAVDQAIAYAGAHGALTIVASGNLGQNNDLAPIYPASSASDAIVSVGATCDGDSLASFSDFGKLSVDIAAPGCDVVSTVPGGGYEARTGTSMAAPEVAAAAALLFRDHPNARPLEVKRALLGGATPEPALDGLVSTGAVLDLARARAAFVASDTTPPAAFSEVAPSDAFTARRTEFYYDHVTFHWTPSSDAALAGYRLLLDGVPVAAVGTGSTSVTYPVVPGDHRWSVVAYDRSGNETTALRPQ
jgi:subtilisin family serine protease